MRGDGQTEFETDGDVTWARVKINASTNLENIVAIRGNYYTMVALTADNKVYTWGERTLAGSENVATQAKRYYATEMTLPGATPIKMIGVANNGTSSNSATYYILYLNGKLFAMGNNQRKQLGDFTSTASPSSSARRWVHCQYTSDPADTMNDIRWISPGEHDPKYPAISVINHDARLYSWGSNASHMLGRSNDANGTGAFDPGQPLESDPFFPLSSNVIAVETGGHTTMIAQECQDKFGYVGHAVNGSAGSTGSTQYQTYTFSTAPIRICGANTNTNIEYAILPLKSNSDKFCSDQEVMLQGMPAGGVFTIISGPGVLTGDVLNFTANTGTVRVRYTNTASSCLPNYTEKDFEIEQCTIYKVKGSVWNDVNGDVALNGIEALTNGANSEAGGLWANLVNSDGEVMASVPVKADGTYELPTTQNGIYSVTLTTGKVARGLEIPASLKTLPSAWEYTGTQANGTTCAAPTCSHTISGINLSGSEVTGINFGIRGRNTVSGSIFNNGAGLSNGTVSGSPISNPGGEQLYISIIDITGKVLDYVPVNPDGTYEIRVPLQENAMLQLTTTLPVIGSTSPAATLPNGWHFVGEDFGAGNGKGTGVNDGSGTGSNASATRYDGKIFVSFPSGTSVTGVHFGINRAPAADAKSFTISQDGFSETPPTGFPTIANYRSIPAVSPLLKDINGDPAGSFSGSDPEDCASGDCNGYAEGTASSFAIGTVNANTKLFYDFGGSTGVLEVTAGSVIENFDVNRFVIYGQNGEGTSGKEIGFTYSIIDKAGISSSFVSYTVQTFTALPVQLISFQALKKGNSVDLFWLVHNEESLATYQIERSNDGKSWYTIGTISAKGSGSYSIKDSEPGKTVNYYRLKMIDVEKKYQYSDVRILRFSAVSVINIRPNPTKNDIVIDGLSIGSTIRIFDYSGRLLIKEKATDVIQKVQTHHLIAGMYQIIITDDNGNMDIHRFMKIN